MPSHTFSDGTHTWDVKALWLLAAGITPVSMPLTLIPDSVDLLKSTCWTRSGDWVKALTIEEILKHADRVVNADLTVPIILTPEMSVADGYHRLVRCIQLKRTKILAVRLAIMPPPLLGWEPK